MCLPSDFAAVLRIKCLRDSTGTAKIVRKSGRQASDRWQGDGRMYAFLLALGAAITAAGCALVASSVSMVSVQDHAFDVSEATPGIIAIIGGCILIGLAFVVRALLRVERALTAKPVPRAARPGEISPEGPAERASEVRIPLPPKPAAAAAASTQPAAAEQASSEKSPGVERDESAPVVDAGDVSLLPNPPARSDEDNSVAHSGAAKLNGSVPATTAPRVAGGPAARPQAKTSIFDTLWPKGPRPSAEAHPATTARPAPAAAASAPSVPAAEPALTLASPAAASQTPAGVSILKSGVVEGMAYTLYSDGSIEAQLPGGTLRFRSITELRSHIEQNG